MPVRRDYTLTQHCLNAAVALGYAVAFLAGAGAGFQSHRVSGPARAPLAQAAPAGPGAQAWLASIR